jgi:8-oxo-dGTP pyrophosphatase MutT (NUDIX family)
VVNLPRSLRAAVYGTFYRLPLVLRRRIVRLVVQKYVVGAVVLVRDSEATVGPGRLLMIKQPPGRGWGLPAGLLQRREPPPMGAARELREETGIDLSPADLTPAVPSAVVHARGWVDIVFETSVPASRTVIRADGAEVLEIGWHPIDALPPLTTATARLLGHYDIGPAAARRMAVHRGGPAADGPAVENRPR